MSQFFKYTRWRTFLAMALLLAGIGSVSSALANGYNRPSHLQATPVVTDAQATATVLVMDLSGSMADPEASGVSKIEAAKKAALQLLQAVGQENAASPIHQMGLVSFRESAQVESPLTTDMASLEASVQQMFPDGGTNIGDGLYKALDLLTGAPPTARKFIILLSDGLPNHGLQSVQEFLDGPVAQARSMGVCIYTIGLGEGGEMNAELLRAIAEGSGCGQFYLAKEAFQLRTIYVRIQHKTTGERVQEWQGQIRQGEEVPVGNYQVLDNQELLDVSLVWPGSKLEVKLKDPNNVIVDDRYPNAKIFETPASQRIMVERPMPGDWRLTVVGVEVPEPVIPYSLIASSRMMQVTPTPTWTPMPSPTITPTPTSTPTPLPESAPEPPPKKSSGLFWFLLLGAGAVLIIAVVFFSARRKRKLAYLELAAGPFAGRRFYIDETPFFIGRSATNHLVLSDPELSRRHAVIRFQQGVFTIEDLGSRIGVFVNGQKVLRSPLHDGDHIKLAQTVFTFHQG